MDSKVLEKQPGIPLKITYCPNCGLPSEFCEYGGSYEKCKLLQKELIPDVLTSSNTLPETNESEKKEEAKEVKEETKEIKEPAPTPETKEIKEETKPKEKRVRIQEDKKISLTKTKRSKHKYLLTIQGLEKYDIVPKEAAKKFGKKFACGASALPDGAIEMQGDISMEVMAYIMEEYPTIAQKDFTFIDKSNK